MNIEDYKKAEITEHLTYYLSECNADQIDIYKNDLSELHHHAFNADYYIIGTWQATEWLGDRAFEIVQFIKEYEQGNFGEVSTDLSDPEKVVNMFTYIVGEHIVYNEAEQLLK